jgi:hypothetical protein
MQRGVVVMVFGNRTAEQKIIYSYMCNWHNVLLFKFGLSKILTSHNYLHRYIFKKRKESQND